MDPFNILIFYHINLLPTQCTLYYIVKTNKLILNFNSYFQSLKGMPYIWGKQIRVGYVETK